MLVSVSGRFLDILYPPRCPGCGRFGTLLCPGCKAGLPLVPGTGRCGLCRGRWDGADYCPRCFSWDAIDEAVIPCDMEGTARRLVHAFKYRGVRVLAPVLAEIMANVLPAGNRLGMAVPLHPRRERKRGFNQSEVLLRALGLESPPGSLHRVRRTRTQVGMRERARRRNVGGAFVYRGPPLRGLHILLVDDVVTTGATVDECARVLRDHGAVKVTVAAFARANYHPGEDPAAD